MNALRYIPAALGICCLLVGVIAALCDGGTIAATLILGNTLVIAGAIIIAGALISSAIVSGNRKD